jgi:hypothetical protein
MFEEHITIARVIQSLVADSFPMELQLLATTRHGKFAASTVGIRMNPHRSLRSYRLKPGDIIICTRSLTSSLMWQRVGGNDLAVVITFPNPANISKTMKFPINSTLYEIKSQFFKKSRVNLPLCSYGFFLDLDDNHDCEDFLDDLVILGSITTAPPVRLFCKFKPRKPRSWFGVDPQTLPFVTSLGIEVPEVLEILKDLLLSNNGLATEGIFRKAGSELEMKVLAKKIDEGEQISTKDVHTVATLIKRWYKQLPQRLLYQQDLSAIVADESLKLNLLSILSPLYGNLLVWLFRLCMIIINNYETTLMDAKNLGL